MRLIALALVLAAPGFAPAQSASYLALVGDAEVRLRAGPSDSFPDTGMLAAGTRVLVEREEAGGWLAIQAPPGCVSWVPHALIDFDNAKPLPQNVTAQGEVALAAGRVGLNQPVADKQVRRAKVPEGTILTVIGERITFEGQLWHPVSPPAGDVRYIPKSAVQAERGANTSFSVRTNEVATPIGATGSGAATTAGGLAASIPTPKPPTNNPLWAQAEAAERDGRLDDAEKLYFQIARAANEAGGDNDLANRCYSRIHGLREKKRGATTNPPPARDERASLPPPARDAGGLPPKDRNPPPANDNAKPSGERPDWQKPGMLSRASIAPDGKKTYALESSPGVVLMYVQAGDGIDAERYVNRRVAVYGTPTTRPRLSKPLIVALAIDPAGN